MSRTIRRKNVRLNIKGCISTTEHREYHLTANNNYDHQHNFSLYASELELNQRWVQKAIALYYRDAGNRKSWRSIKAEFNIRYRRQCKQKFRRYLREENDELMLAKHNKFDSGFWFD